MRKIILVAALCLLSSVALADATWTVTRNGVKVGEKVFTDAQEARMIQWATNNRKGAIVQTPAVAAVPADVDKDGNVTKAAVDAKPEIRRDPTTPETHGFIADDFFVDLVNRSSAWLKSEAARAAADSVQPVTTK